MMERHSSTAASRHWKWSASRHNPDVEEVENPSSPSETPNQNANPDRVPRQKITKNLRPSTGDTTTRKRQQGADANVVIWRYE